MGELGVGALTISEMARRMGVRPPSLYKYFASLHSVYEQLFARGLALHMAAVNDATVSRSPGLDRLRAGMSATVQWAVGSPALAQLLFWRVVPGFEPSPATFKASVEDMATVRGELAAAVEAGELSPAADSDRAVRILTVLMSGLISQQLANEPGASFETGRFSSLTDEAFDVFVDHYRP